MRNWLKTALFLSAFSPALVSMALARWLDTACFTADIAYYACAGVLGASLALVIIRAIKKHSESLAFKAKKIESNDALMLGVMVSYILPFFGRASHLTAGIVIALIFLFAMLLWFSNAILPHPLLRILSFRFYKVESEAGMVYTLITQRELLDPKNIKAVKRISNSMLVEVM